MWLSEEERKHTAPADDAAFPSPVPTQIVSNGEYNPMPQTEQQRQVEGRIKELADQYAHKQNMDRRSFLKNTRRVSIRAPSDKTPWTTWRRPAVLPASAEAPERRDQRLSRNFSAASDGDKKFYPLCPPHASRGMPGNPA